MKLLDFILKLEHETAGVSLKAGAYAVVVEDQDGNAETVVNVRIDNANGRLVIQL